MLNVGGRRRVQSRPLFHSVSFSFPSKQGFTLRSLPSPKTFSCQFFWGGLFQLLLLVRDVRRPMPQGMQGQVVAAAVSAATLQKPARETVSFAPCHAIVTASGPPWVKPIPKESCSCAPRGRIVCCEKMPRSDHRLSSSL